jgi:hypothetical protein
LDFPAYSAGTVARGSFESEFDDESDEPPQAVNKNIPTSITNKIFFIVPFFKWVCITKNRHS